MGEGGGEGIGGALDKGVQKEKCFFCLWTSQWVECEKSRGWHITVSIIVPIPASIYTLLLYLSQGILRPGTQGGLSQLVSLSLKQYLDIQAFIWRGRYIDLDL